ncbi:hypothetical protein ACVWY3_004867 [Bradyrhizobium sp. USDA 4486]
MAILNAVRSPFINLNARALFRTHMPYASALPRLKERRPANRPASDTEEGEQLARILGDKSLLFVVKSRHAGYQ